MNGEEKDAERPKSRYDAERHNEGDGEITMIRTTPRYDALRRNDSSDAPRPLQADREDELVRDVRRTRSVRNPVTTQSVITRGMEKSP